MHFTIISNNMAAGPRTVAVTGLIKGPMEVSAQRAAFLQDINYACFQV